MALGHESLENMYRMNFALMQYHGYSLTELENMIPFERDVYVSLLLQHLDQEKQRLENKKNG